MVAKKSGRIINIISTYALGAPPSQLASYVTAKSGLTGLSRALAAELGPLGITDNMVAPGLTDTEMISYLPQRYRDVIAHQTPLKRIATPADVAKTVLFLASEAATFINGALIPVSGGHTMN
jgi:3-oxoacyl-[acyl-carrier protein] reductase